ncbi:MAG: hypothetical protein JST82_05265 [Bacteroidetes bacterium]|nr:hypothetical protein [Bacteroidota bacterium]
MNNKFFSLRSLTQTLAITVLSLSAYTSNAQMIEINNNTCEAKKVWFIVSATNCGTPNGGSTPITVPANSTVNVDIYNQAMPTSWSWNGTPPPNYVDVVQVDVEALYGTYNGTLGCSGSYNMDGTTVLNPNCGSPSTDCFTYSYSTTDCHIGCPSASATVTCVTFTSPGTSQQWQIDIN